jgi:peptidyl-prolyl cis-trans isomerase SurA
MRALGSLGFSPGSTGNKPVSADSEMSKSRLVCSSWLLVTFLFSGAADATIVERVVAVVGDRPILLSDVRQRTQPFYKTLPSSPSERAAAQSSLFSQMLDKMIEEELIARAAVKAQVQVTREEVDAALERVAKGNNVEIEDLFTEVEATGITRTQYRNEIRRQLMDAKVVNLRLQGRMRISEEDVRREYDALLEQERRQLPFKVAAIRVADTGSESIALARSVANRARDRADFAELCRKHCTDKGLREAGGLLPIALPSDLPKELSKAAVLLDVGQVSSPIKSGNDWVVLKVVERDPSSLPPFAEAANQLMQRVQIKKMEQARASWLKTLRKQHHVEVR